MTTPDKDARRRAHEALDKLIGVPFVSFRFINATYSASAYTIEIRGRIVLTFEDSSELTISESGITLSGLVDDP